MRSKGGKLVLYFYPKDMTPGCTLEGQDFRDLHAAFKRAKTTVLGISRTAAIAREVPRQGKASVRAAVATRTKRSAGCST